MTKHERSSLAPAHNRNPGMRTGSETSENAERPTSNVEGREQGTEDSRLRPAVAGLLASQGGQGAEANAQRPAFNEEIAGRID